MKKNELKDIEAEHANLSPLETLREMYWIFTPTSKKTKEKFLEMVRDKVNYYQPMIENRCGVNLGKINVRDNKGWASDIFYKEAPLEALENAWKQGKTPTELDYTLSFIGASFSEFISFIPVKIYDAFSLAQLRHYDHTIYVPFNYMNKFVDLDFKDRIKRLDYSVVHELSHSLWDRLSSRKLFGEDNKTQKKSNIWNEGFATYCAHDFFVDFYPKNYERPEDLLKVYAEGKKKVEKVIENHGKWALFDIPKKWKEFEKEEGKK